MFTVVGVDGVAQVVYGCSMFRVRRCPGCGAGVIQAVSSVSHKLVLVDADPVEGGLLRLRMERDSDGSLLLPKAIPVDVTMDLFDADDGVRYRPHYLSCTDPMARRRRELSHR